MGAYCTQWSWAIKCCGMQENILGTNTSWRTQLLERRCVRTVKPWTSSFLVSGYRTLYFKNMQHIMTQSGIGATTAVQVKGRRQICVVWTREMSSVAAEYWSNCEVCISLRTLIIPSDWADIPECISPQHRKQRQMNINIKVLISFKLQLK